MDTALAPPQGDHDARIRSIDDRVDVAVLRRCVCPGAFAEPLLRCTLVQMNAHPAAMIEISPSRGEQQSNDVGRDGALGTSALRVAGEMNGCGGMGAYRLAQG